MVIKVVLSLLIKLQKIKDKLKNSWYTLDVEADVLILEDKDHKFGFIPD